jgi:hypothetical protein
VVKQEVSISWDFCNAPTVIRLARLIEPLYVEGLDLQAPLAKS